MKILKYFFSLLFICTLVVTSLQFSFFDLEDVAVIQLVEEENEEQNVDSELISLEFVEEIVWAELNTLHCYNANHFEALHTNKKYKRVYLSVPHSPPDFS